jgi:hypothetical protein
VRRGLDLAAEQRSSRPASPWAANRASHRCAHWREITIASAAWATTYPRTPSDRHAAGLIAYTPAAGLDAAGAREGGAPAVALHPVGMMHRSQRIGDGEGPVSGTGLSGSRRPGRGRNGDDEVLAMTTTAESTGRSRTVLLMLAAVSS